MNQSLQTQTRARISSNSDTEQNGRERRNSAIQISKRSSSVCSVVVPDVVQEKKKLFGGLKQAGNYVFKSTIASGGSARVFNANFKNLNLRPSSCQEKSVAVKVTPLRSDESKNSLRVQKLLNEAQCMKRCQGHPNILTLHETMTSPTNFFMVTEKCPMGDIFDITLVHGIFDLETSRSFFCQLISAVHHMHSTGVAHRDIKPENVLLGGKNNNQIKLCDFGFAIEWNPKMKPLTQPMGTLRCLPPEMIKTKVQQQVSYDAFAADMWSCGVVLFFLLTGSFPFSQEGQDEKLVLKNIKTGTFVNDMPSSALSRDLLLHLLHPNPKKRFSSADALKHGFLSRNRKAIL